MGWRRAWRIAGVAYTELAFQSIYAVRAGNLLAATEGPDLAARARRRVAQSKFLVSLLIAFVAAGSYIALTPTAERLFQAPWVATYQGTILAGLLLLELTLIWTTGLQVIPTYLGSRILPLLETLPIADADLNRVAVILMLRLFDTPAAMCLGATPLAVGLALHSPLAGLAVLPGVVLVLLLGAALALGTGRFFVRRVQGSRGGGHRAFVRWAFLVLWAIPAFAIYGFISFSPEFLRFTTSLANGGPSPLNQALWSVFPFPLALLPVLASGTSLAPIGTPVFSSVLLPSLVVAYGAIGAAILLWLRHAPRRLAQIVPLADPRPSVGPTRLVPVGRSYAVLLKDLRTASRTPGYAFLILLPLLDAVVIGLSSFLGNPRPSDVFNLGAAAVSTAALLATFFGPAFFSTEVMGYAYTRSLPLPNRALVWGKSSLVVLIYVLASALVLGLTLIRVFTPLLFLAFVVAEFPGLLAASFLQLGILFRHAEKKGVPFTNLYTGAWWTISVVFPGILVVGIPLLVYEILRGSAWALPAMGAVAVTELALFAPFALGLPGRVRD